MKRKQRVHHRRHSHQREQAGADAADRIAKVQEADGQTAKEDGEVEIGEEGPLVGEEDFWFDAGGEGDAFSCAGACERMGRVGNEYENGQREDGIPGVDWRSGWLDILLDIQR